MCNGMPLRPLRHEADMSLYLVPGYAHLAILGALDEVESIVVISSKLMP